METKTYTSGLTLGELEETIKSIKGKRFFYGRAKDIIIKNKDEFKLEAERPFYQKMSLIKVISLKALRASDNKLNITLKSKDTGTKSILDIFYIFAIIIGLILGVLPGIVILIFYYFTYFKPLKDFEKNTIEEVEEQLNEAQIRCSRK